MTPAIIAASRRLVEIVALLRRDIDTHRIIGLNIGILDGADLPQESIAHAQHNALRMIVIGIRKGFDRPRQQHKLHSVPGICDLLADPALDSHEPRKVACAKAFAEDLNLSHSGGSAADIVKAAHESFVARHEADLERLRKLRNQEIAHADASYLPLNAASHDFYEAAFGYLRDFQLFLSHAYGTPATVIPHSLGCELVRFIRKIDPSARQFFERKNHP